MRKTIIAVSLLLLCSMTYAEILPTYTPLSPHAAALTTYVDIPVSHYTGVPNISIPLYEINVHGFTLPISLSYHASGVKASQEASWVGLGWVLNTGGVITRSVRSRDDLNAAVSYHKADEKKDTPLSLQELYSSEYNDFEPDVFSYNFGGYTGKFILEKKDRNIKEDVILLEPESNLKITIKRKSNGAWDWVIIDEKGIRYTFSVEELTTVYSVIVKEKIENPYINERHDSRPIPTAWYLSEIELLNGEKIEFKYENNKSGIQYVSHGEQVKHHRISYCTMASTGLYGHQSNYYVNVPQIPDYYFYTQAYINTEVYLNEIKWSEGKMSFKTSRKNDINSSSCQKLDAIEIYSNASPTTPLKTCRLLYDYFNASYVSNTTNNDYNKQYLYPRLKLTHLQEQSEGASLTHSFFYNEQMSLPPKNTKNHDHWGYFNKANNSTYLVPEFHYQGPPAPEIPCNNPSTNNDSWVDANLINRTFAGADRTSNIEMMKLGTLRKITYPTGGACNFYYEANTYLAQGSDAQHNVDAGGLRIARIEVDATTRYFEYKNSDGKSSGKLLVMPQYATFAKQEGMDGAGGYYTCIILQISSQSRFPLSDFVRGIHLGYSKVKEFVADNGDTSATMYTFKNNPEEFQSNGVVKLPNFSNGLPLEVIYLKNSIPVRKEIFSYDSTKQKVMTAIKTEPVYNLSSEGYHSGRPSLGMYNFYHHFSEWWRLKGKKTVDYFHASTQDSIVTEAYYEYNSSYKISETTITSKEVENLKTKFYYPTDFANTAPYNSMVEKNMLSPIVEQQEYLGNTKLSTTKNSYRLHNSIPVLDDTQLRQGDNPPGTHIRYHSYDAYNNPVYISRNDGEHVVYLWSYKGQYLIAKIENATYDQVNAYVDINALSALAEPSMSVITNLRSIPTLSQALITTYTYKLLVGMTSQTDPRGVTTYYEYDSMSRLERVLDHDKNIIQVYAYNYANK